MTVGDGVTGHKRTILLDTNIIIEAVRTGCWDGLRGHYELVTVEKCREEARSGIGRTPGYVTIEDRHLNKNIMIVRATELERARLATACPDVAVLDDGERDLWAHAYSLKDDWEAATADRAAVRVAILLGWGDRLVSLETLVNSGGIRLKKNLKTQYTSKWLVEWRTEFKMDM